jgi:hypothetical protein
LYAHRLLEQLEASVDLGGITDDDLRLNVRVEEESDLLFTELHVAIGQLLPLGDTSGRTQAAAVRLRELVLQLRVFFLQILEHDVDVNLLVDVDVHCQHATTHSKATGRDCLFKAVRVTAERGDHDGLSVPAEAVA